MGQQLRTRAKRVRRKRRMKRLKERVRLQAKTPKVKQPVQAQPPKA
jgi:hypothetical protein